MAFSLWPFPSVFHEDRDVETELGPPSDSTFSEHAPAESSTTARPSLLSLLQHYDSPGVPPPSARVGPLINQDVRKPMRIFDLWRYGYVVATKSAEITADLMSHYIWGPRKPSWGVEMTLITSIMRNANRHTQLADITTLRSLIQIGGLVPLPSNAMVTPLTFRVKRRGLRGLLAEYDAREDGKREVSGEWVVGKRLWQRLQSEWKASQSNKKGASGVHSKQRVVLYLHGGAYYVFSAATHRLITIPLSKYVDARVFAIDYRLAPETHFPGPLHDAVSAYFRLLDDLHIPPENILIAGDSAGGGLSLALLMYLRDNDYPMPSGAILMSPWVDLTMSCDSWDSNAPFDIVPFPDPSDHLNPVACYLGSGMGAYLTHPYASPLFGDFHGLPPMLIQHGDAEVLRDEVTLLAHKATLAGVEVRHELYEDAVHVFQMFPFLDTARRSLLSCREFVRDVLPRHQRRSPHVIESAALEHETGNMASRLVGGDGLEVDTPLPACEQVAADADAGVDALGGANATNAAVDDIGWIRPQYGPVSPTSSLPQERDGTSVDPDTQPALPPSPSPSPTSAHTFHAAELPPLAPSAFASTPSLAQHLKHFTLGHSPSSPSRSPSFSPPSPSSPAQPTTESTKSESSARSIDQDRDPPGWSFSTRRRPQADFVSTNSPAPAPTIRSRHRAVSHPDMAQLCRDWAQGPANQTKTFRPDR